MRTGTVCEEQSMGAKGIVSLPAIEVVDTSGEREWEGEVVGKEER